MFNVVEYIKPLYNGKSVPISLNTSQVLPNNYKQHHHAAANTNNSNNSNTNNNLLDLVLHSFIFKQWYQSLVKQLLANQSLFTIDKIEVNSIDFFGTGKIGFIKLRTLIAPLEQQQQASGATSDVKKKGPYLPGIVLLRGDAVCILMILTDESTGQAHVLFTSQPRVAIPDFNFCEIPAGMLDGSGNVKGKALEEIEEETGLVIEAEQLTELAVTRNNTSTTNTTNTHETGIAFGPGLVDEHISVFLYEKTVKSDMIKSIQGKESGLRDKGELITLKLVPLEDAWRFTRDAKALVALFLYEKQVAAKKSNKE